MADRHGAGSSLQACQVESRAVCPSSQEFAKHLDPRPNRESYEWQLKGRILVEGPGSQKPGNGEQGLRRKRPLPSKE